MTDEIVTVEDVITSIVTGDDGLIVTETVETAVITSETNEIVVEVFDGKDGYSAYQLAVLNGFVGTETEWLASLQGSTTSLYFSISSPTAIGGNRAVLSSGYYADCTDTATIGRVIGITMTATTIGELMAVAYAGELNGFYGLTPNQPVYLSTNGTVTQTPPISGYIQKLGVAKNSGSILINIETPIEVI